MSEIQSRVKTYLENGSQHGWRVAAGSLVLIALIIVSELGISIPQQVTVSFVGYVTLSFAVVFCESLIKRYYGRPWHEMVSALVEILPLLGFTFLATIVEAHAWITIAVVLYLSENINSLILEKENPLGYWREGNQFEAVMSSLYYCLGLIAILNSCLLMLLVGNSAMITFA
jgi:hypothetical protein